MKVILKGDHAKFFKGVWDSLKTLVTEVEMNFSPDKFYLKTIDSMGVCFAYLEMPKEDFEEYVCEKEEKYCISTLKMYGALWRIKGDTIELNDTAKPGKFTINGDKKEFNLGLYTIDVKARDLPDDIKFTTTANVPTKEMKEILDDLIVVNKDEVILTGVDGKIVFSASDDVSDAGSGSIPYQGEPMNVKLAHVFMRKVLNMGFDEVKLSCGTNYPAKFDYSKDTKKLFYVIAPRV